MTDRDPVTGRFARAPEPEPVLPRVINMSVLDGFLDATPGRPAGEVVARVLRDIEQGAGCWCSTDTR